MTAIRKVEIRDQLAKSTEGVPLIGWFVYWSNTNVKASVVELKKKAQSLGLNPDAILDVRAKSAFIRAVEEVASKSKSRHQKVLDDSARCGYILVTTQVDAFNLDATFTVETKAVLNKTSNEITVTGPFEAEIKALYADYKDHYFSDQFRDMTLRLMNHHCQFLTIRDRGGIYFVPACNEDGLELVKKLYQDYPECSLETVGVANMAEARKSMWKSLVGEVTDELQAMKEDVALLGTDVSDASLKCRMDRFRALRDKVENYELVLSGTAQDLKGELNELSMALQHKLTG